MAICIDCDLHNADWTKISWDLPAYKSEEFMDYLRISQMTLEDFRKLPVYKHAVRKGLIIDDEWQGKNK
ncbi:hypothetical protein SPSYN_01176 [Sporotomaculum syntrophicum]|uniref:Uncharacterized protein n=1 Tax=Sporotomaculum syntrophicum TaxID=182264 RepID=A0A9D2WQ28_9FIRM|nr:hypothetical protein [Sporotomaculum syntrophicum]KAF1085040.1 hypothetical protein SPSYN_01176 [Sporotomaculum syntrophicum]